MKKIIQILVLLSFSIGLNAQKITELSQEKDGEHRLIRYSNSTSKLINGYTNNWIIFKTEYEINEYTGEMSNTPVKIGNYIHYNKVGFDKHLFYVDLIAAKIEKAGGYTLTMKDNKIRIKMPSGVVFSSVLANIETSKIVIQGFTNGQVIGCLKDLYNIPGANIICNGIYGNQLQKVNKNDNDTYLIGYGNDLFDIILYDEITHRIYSYGYKNQEKESVFQVFPTSNDDESRHVVVNCLPNDSITRFVQNYSTYEIYYKNSDYLKFSMLKDGEIFECLIHRPDGLFTIKLENNKPVINYQYVAGDYKGLIFYPNRGQTYSYKDVIGNETIVYPAKWDEFLDSKTKRRLIFSEEGTLYDDIAKKHVYVGKKLLEQKEKEKQERTKYMALCQKYGKKYVDAIRNNNKILIGTPESLIVNILDSSLIGENQFIKKYWIGGLMGGRAATVTVDKKTKRVSSVIY